MNKRNMFVMVKTCMIQEKGRRVTSAKMFPIFAPFAERVLSTENYLWSMFTKAIPKAITMNVPLVERNLPTSFNYLNIFNCVIQNCPLYVNSNIV